VDVHIEGIDLALCYKSTGAKAVDKGQMWTCVEGINRFGILPRQHVKASVAMSL
jgi:hypothetical protein